MICRFLLHHEQVKRQNAKAKGRSRLLLPFDFSAFFPICLLPSAYCLLTLCFAQAPPNTPYAVIDHDAVTYNGPDGHDLIGSVIRLGLLAPLAGPRQSEGEALRRAAELAIEEENAISLPGGRRLALVTRDESGPWGQASAQILHMVIDDVAVALITSADGDSAHLAEQVGNKIGVPVLTLSTDSTTTEINLPWIFRLGPTDTEQARAFTRDIYQHRKMQRVVLLAQTDRDGRLGGEEFAKAAAEVSTVAPARILVDPAKLSARTTWKELETAQCVVIWTDAAAAKLLTARVRELRPGVPLYLCRKAAEGESSDEHRKPCPACDNDDQRWIAATPQSREVSERFSERYRHRFGAEPGLGAAEAYDAVRVLAIALRQSGPNRARLRDALAGVSAFPGVAGGISFDHAGNNTSPVTLVKLR